MSEYEYYRKDWMSDDQWNCCKFVADLFGGFHHVLGEFKPCGMGVEINVQNNSLDTFDGDTLTRATFMAHDRMIRFGVSSSSPRTLKLRLWQRHSREGSLGSRHPSIEQALASFRKYNPEPAALAKESEAGE